MTPSTPGVVTDISHSCIVSASFIGTAIELYDLYVYATAAALVIGPVFFPHGFVTAQALSAFVMFDIAFIARPIGPFLSGHFGGCIGRKSISVASLLVIGTLATLIGLVPGYDGIGTLAPILLYILRSGQGIGPGGEWGGAALLTTENTPVGKRAWFDMFLRLSPPVGFLVSNGPSLRLAIVLFDGQFRSWGWCVPFLVSVVLVTLGLYVRLKIAETPAFQAAIGRQGRAKVPAATLLAYHWWPTLLGVLAMTVCYTLFYVLTAFSLSYGVGTLHSSRPSFLGLLYLAAVFMGLATPLLAWASDRFRRKPVPTVGIITAILSGSTMAPLLGSGQTSLVALFLIIELPLMGMTFTPMDVLLPGLFPTNVYYTETGMSYNPDGILGAPITPYITQKLAQQGSLNWVGMYVLVAAVVSLIGVLCICETRDIRLM